MVCVFLHSGDYDRIHQGLSIAATAAASGQRADVYFFWWALKRLADDALDAPDFAQEWVNDAFERRNIPTLRQLLSHLKESGNCRLYACSGSLEILGLRNDAVASRVDQVVGWSTILQATAGVAERFYL